MRSQIGCFDAIFEVLVPWWFRAFVWCVCDNVIPLPPLPPLFCPMLNSRGGEKKVSMQLDESQAEQSFFPRIHIGGIQEKYPTFPNCNNLYLFFEKSPCYGNRGAKNSKKKEAKKQRSRKTGF